MSNMAARSERCRERRLKTQVSRYLQRGNEPPLTSSTTKSLGGAIAADATGVASPRMKSTDRSTASLFTSSTSNPNVKEPAMKVETREENLEERVKPLKSFLSRRSFLGKSLAMGAGTMGAGLLAKTLTAQVSNANSRGGLTRGDADILRFLAAADLIEADLWLQYNE